MASGIGCPYQPLEGWYTPLSKKIKKELITLYESPSEKWGPRDTLKYIPKRYIANTVKINLGDFFIVINLLYIYFCNL